MKPFHRCNNLIISVCSCSTQFPLVYSLDFRCQYFGGILGYLFKLIDYSHAEAHLLERVSWWSNVCHSSGKCNYLKVLSSIIMKGDISKISRCLEVTVSVSPVHLEYPELTGQKTWWGFFFLWRNLLLFVDSRMRLRLLWHGRVSIETSLLMSSLSNWNRWKHICDRQTVFCLVTTSLWLYTLIRWFSTRLLPI